jgi:hypothetical protein
VELNRHNIVTGENQNLITAIGMGIPQNRSLEKRSDG